MQAIFNMQETYSKRLKLPDRQEMTLCKAVTALFYGKASDALRYMLHGEAGTTEEQSVKVRDLIERLHEAAYAGRIKFRALKNGDNHADGHKDIDHLYFSEERGLRWDPDEIWVRDLYGKRQQLMDHWATFCASPARVTPTGAIRIREAVS